MDDIQFDNLVKRLARTRVTRITAMRGLAGGGLAGLARAAVPDEATAARLRKKNEQLRKTQPSKEQKQAKLQQDDGSAYGRGGGSGKQGRVISEKKGKKKPLCHCPDGNPANCQTLKVKKKARNKHLKQHQFDYIGACTSPTPCTNHSECDPQVCVNGVCQPCTHDSQCATPRTCNKVTGQCVVEGTTTTGQPGTTTTTTAAPCLANDGECSVDGPGECCSTICCRDTTSTTGGICATDGGNCCNRPNLGGYCPANAPFCCGTAACCVDSSVCCASALNPPRTCCPSGFVCEPTNGFCIPARDTPARDAEVEDPTVARIRGGKSE